MRKISKFLLFFIAFALVIPIAFINVSAEYIYEPVYSDAALPSYDGIDIFESHSDGSGFVIPEDYLSSSGYPQFYNKNRLAVVTEEEFESIYCTTVNEKAFTNSPYAYIKYSDTGNYGVFNLGDRYVRFIRTLYDFKYWDVVDFDTTTDYYYFTTYFSYSTAEDYSKSSGSNYVYTDETYHMCLTFLSKTPFEVIENDDGTFQIDGDISDAVLSGYYTQSGTYKDSDFTTSFSYLAGSSSIDTIYFNEYLQLDFEKSFPSLFSLYPDYGTYECYTNCDMDLSMLSYSENPIISGFSSLNATYNVGAHVDVNFTPEFTLDMDRSVPGSVFGGINEDYFSIEITNNNPFAIQFQCYVIPSSELFSYIDSWSKNADLKSAAMSEYDLGYPGLINISDDIPRVPDECVWMLEKNQWVYSRNVENQSDYGSGFAFEVNKPSTCFYLPAGQTFSQVIKWNQLNLVANSKYRMIVSAAKNTFDKATDIHLSIASDSYFACDNSIFLESYFFCCDTEFSVNNPLTYNSSEDFGGVIANTGRLETDRDYWKQNAIILDDEVVIRDADSNDYYNGWRTDIDDGWTDTGSFKFFDFDLNNISIDDFSTLLNNVSSFISVLGSVFSFFPKWVWVLIFVGILGMVALGFFKTIT